MVIKGRGKFPTRKAPQPTSPTPNITKIASLTKQPASDKALELIHEIATLVTPILHHYNFKVGLLCEMYPKNPGLLGLNVNRGQKICLRLRSSTDSRWFLDRDEIIGTMLHELTHNWHGPHNNIFYKTLDELKDKYMEFQVNQSMKNTSYPNNFSSNILRKKSTIKPPIYTTRISKLGTNMNSVSKSVLTSEKIRDLMLQAAERRLQDSKKCAELEADKLKNVPNDEDLHIIDVISLDSDDEVEKKADLYGNASINHCKDKVIPKAKKEIKIEKETEKEKEIIVID